MRQDIDVYSMTFRFASGAPLRRLMFPGGCLDPNYAVNNKVWVASGQIENINVDADATLAPIIVEIFDPVDANHRQWQIGTNLGAHVIAGCTALRAGVGSTGAAPAVAAGTPILDVITPDQNPFLTPFLEQGVDQASDNSRRMHWDVESVAAANARLPFQWFGPIRCRNGMVVKLLGGAANLGQACAVTISYKPDMLGWMRYQRSQPQYAGRLK